MRIPLVASWRPGLLAGLLSASIAACSAAQSLEQRVFAGRESTVRLTFATREDVCGNGDHNISIHQGADDGWRSDCDHGPAHVTIRVREGELSDIVTRVGGSWVPKSGVTDLGAIPPKEAAQFFLRLARRDSKAAHEAILPAIIADSVDVTRDLVSLARDEKVRKDVRKSAIFWVGQAAADAATKDLEAVVGDAALDRDVRESAIFALSQRPHEQGVPALLAVARSNRDPELRRKAIFWLGQTEDPRALAYFEEVLTRPAGR